MHRYGAAASSIGVLNGIAAGFTDGDEQFSDR